MTPCAFTQTLASSAAPARNGCGHRGGLWAGGLNPGGRGRGRGREKAAGLGQVQKALPCQPPHLGRFLGVTCNPWPPTGWQGRGGDQRPGDVLCQIRLACLSSGMIQTLVQADRMENGAAGENLRGPSFPSLRPGPVHRSGRPHMYAVV